MENTFFVIRLEISNVNKALNLPIASISLIMEEQLKAHKIKGKPAAGFGSYG